MVTRLVKKQVSIIGAGPVGLTAAYLLEKAGISYALIEKQTEIRQHPAAHLINLRSMEVFNEIELEEKINSQTEDKNYFRCYRYLRRLLDPIDQHYAVHDHFYPNPEQKLKEIKSHTFASYVHLPQNKLTDLLVKNHVAKYGDIFLGSQVLNIKNPPFRESQNKVLIDIKDVNSEKKLQIESDFLIACDGFHSFIRKQQGVQMIGQESIQKFVNIYFHSKKLSDKLIEHDQNAMLHFVYNSDAIGCLVNHTKTDGMFVLQLPVYPPFDKVIETGYQNIDKKIRDQKALDIVNSLIVKEYRLKPEDIDIKNVGIWNLSAMQIEKYFKNRILFAGDSAHSFPPAGGFGMNTGIHEIHNLIHKLRIALDPKLKNDPKKIKSILENYHRERQQYCSFIINETMHEYRKSIEIAKKLGLSPENLHVVKHLISSLPLSGKLSQDIWNRIMKIGTYHLEFDHKKFKSQENLDYIKDSKNLVTMMYYDHDVNYGYSKGHFDMNKKEYFAMIGKIMPHLYIHLGKKYGSKTLSTRQMPNYFEQNKFFGLVQSHEQQKEILYVDQQSLDNLKGEKYYGKHFMVAFYFNEIWEEKKKQFGKLIDEMDIKPDFILGIRLSKAIHIKNSDHQELDFNSIAYYNHKERSDDQLSSEQIAEQDSLLIKRVSSLFLTKNELILMRTDGVIYSIYDPAEMQEN